MSAWCVTCDEAPGDRKGGECGACYQYRWRHGTARPETLMITHAKARSGQRHKPLPRGTSPVIRRLATLSMNRENCVEVCAACGTLQEWPRGWIVPLCGRHRGLMVLVGILVSDQPHSADRLTELLTA